MPRLTLKLEPMQVTKPRTALDAAADLARRVGVHVSLELNGTTVTIGPTQTKASVADDWNAAARAEGEN
jgi:prophage tail gpP-like protein